MKSKSKNSGCTYGTGSDCVTWSGPNIPCIGVEIGMSMTETEYLIACKVCDIADGLDISQLDLTCLIDQSSIPETRDIKLILQLLLDNQCSLKELVDNIDQGSGTVTLSLNLKCLKKFDDFENEIPQDLNQTFQSIINQVCNTVDDVTALQAQADDLQDQIDNLPAPPPPFTEPIITTCVSISKPVSESVILLSTDYCTLKTTIGTPVQIQAGLAKQCDNLNTVLGSEPGWNIAPQNLAQSFSNLWIAYCNVLDRVRAMETTCCAPACDKITIGFVPEFDYTTKEVTLNFTSGAGTNIPTGFVDCGTTLEITDRNKVTLKYQALNITMGGVVGPLSLLGLAQGVLEFDFKTKFCLIDTDGTTIMTCQDCIIKEIDYFDDTCCTITNTSSTSVSIVIDTCQNTNSST